MTRINSNISPKLVNDRMVIAAVREVVRIPNMIKSGKAKIKPNQKQLKFKLGAGHVCFFYDKLKYLEDYYNEWRQEALNRGFKISDYSESFKDLPPQLYNDWEPCLESRKLIVERISERLDKMLPQDIRYYGEIIDKKYLKTLMKNEIRS